MLSSELKNLYDGYYNNGVNQKRILSAKDSVREIICVTEGKKISNILDVGSGDGTVLAEMDAIALSQKISVAEISKSGIDVIEKRKLNSVVEIKQFDGYSVPYTDKVFDVSMAIYVLEHVEHERMFLKELARVANRVVIAVPLENTISLRKSIFAGKSIGHINFYNLHTFRSVLETSGLKIEKSYPYATSLEYEKYCSPRFGAVKYYIRKYMLLVTPKLACFLFTYMAIAICSSSSTVDNEIK